MTRCGWCLAVLLGGLAAGCDDGTPEGDAGATTEGDAGLPPVAGGAAAGDAAPAAQGGQPAPPADAAPVPPTDMSVAPPPDAAGAPPPDAGPPPLDVGPPPLDAGRGPDGGPQDGDRCDPRLRAPACAPGAFCAHVPGAAAHLGRCQAGEGCRPGHDEDCAEPGRGYCHIKGGGTFCAAPGELNAGDDCVNDQGVPQPCAAGLVCNNSVCQQPCEVGAQPTGCPDEGRCADISGAIGVAGGLCAPRGCDWFTGAGCAAGRKCTYAIRNDGVLVGSCTPDRGGNQEGAPCEYFEGGGHNCAVGLHCIGPANREQFCRQLCDTGGYEAPCPAGRRCEERLFSQVGGVVRGYGMCITVQ